MFKMIIIMHLMLIINYARCYIYRPIKNILSMACTHRHSCTGPGLLKGGGLPCKIQIHLWKIFDQEGEEILPIIYHNSAG